MSFVHGILVNIILLVRLLDAKLFVASFASFDRTHKHFAFFSICR